MQLRIFRIGRARRILKMQNQSLRSFLVRDFVVSSNGDQVSVSELEGKTVALYFSSSAYQSCIDFTPELVEVYKELKARGEDFEIVLVSCDETRQSFQESFRTMPWLALPFGSRSAAANRMRGLVHSLPALVIIEADGSILEHDRSINFAEDIKLRGVEAYPFSRAEFTPPTQTEEEQPDWLISWYSHNNNM